MFCPKINVKNDSLRRWHRPDRHFFANGACQVLAFAFLERYPDLGFHARWIKPAASHFAERSFTWSNRLESSIPVKPTLPGQASGSPDCIRFAISFMPE